MPRPPSPCLVQRCPALAVRGGRCAEHARQHDRQQGTAAQRGYGYAWRQLRRRILARNPTCTICRQAPAVEVDHIIPRSQGGTDDESNLRATCRLCNRSRPD